MSLLKEEMPVCFPGGQQIAVIPYQSILFDFEHCPPMCLTCLQGLPPLQILAGQRYPHNFLPVCNI